MNVRHTVCPIAKVYPRTSPSNNVSTDLSFYPCACCGTLLAVYVEPSGSSYCVRCEVAYLEFKLGLLLAVCRSRRTDEV